jgi:DNA repair protein SbcC/Rad50
MRPLKLTLEGFYGVRDGMKRNAITIDLESLPTGLVAITGPNGAGKTTIMDNLHPYRIMPSRATQLSVDAFSYWDHLCGVQALKEFEWEHNGQRYRSSFAFRKPGKTGKADYFLSAIEVDGSWKPVSLPDGTVADGKGETYDRCVEAICGSLESFFTSQFSAQNRRPLASYKATEIKGLLAEMLKIDDLRTLSAKAADVAKALGRALSALQEQIVAYSAKRERLLQTERAIAGDGESLARVRREREALQEKASSLTQQRATLAAKQVENAGVEARLRELDGRRKELQASTQALTRDASNGAQKFAQRRQAARQASSTAQATLAQREAIVGAAAARDEAQTRLARDEARVAPLQSAIDELEAKRLNLATLTSELQGFQSQGTSKAQLLATLEGQAAVIDSVPCKGHEMHATCPLLDQARQAARQAGEQRIALDTLRNQFKAKRQQAEELKPLVEGLATKRQELATVNTAIASARTDLQKATDLAARRPLLEAAETSLATANAELSAIDVEDSELRTRTESEQARLGNQLREVETEASRLAAVDVTAQIALLDRQLVELRQSIAALDGRIEALIRSQATREAEREALGKELAGAEATQTRADRLSDEIAHWKLLAKGLGNEGVIALTIDDAGPALTQTVNDLLLACYGTRFTVEIRTQKALGNGELREGFEILVHDAENDSAKAVGVMSGGQMVWINECLTRGIALYLARNAGQPYQTLFSDESDGPLDPERKLQFMQMKREVLRQGGYEREFFISQTPDLIDEADAVIDVEALAA